jgi:hypothetical protein
MLLIQLCFVRLIYSNAFSSLSICDQSGYEPAHQERSRYTYDCFGAENIVLLTTRFLEVAKSIILILLSLLS